MSEPWTPGPWEADCIDPDKPEYVVWGLPWDNIKDPVASDLTQADARLIAAAPEMAEYVEAAAEDHDDATGWCNLHDTDIDSGFHERLDGGCFVDRARALLSRVRGEA